MANPSLQIGNEKWAIKEDNLLGYSTAGTRFVPQPITMTRASAGTRVNSSGLVETVELLGSEEIVNGDFATDSGWNTSATGISIAGDKLSRDATATLSIVQSSSVITPSVTYKITFEIVDYTSGLLTPRFGYNGTGGTAVSGVGTYTQIITKVNQNVIELYGTAFIGSISNVSVKEYTANNLARVDYDGTASSLLVEPERTNLITTSEDFDAYRIAGSTVTPNSTTAPDGTNSGILVTQGVATLVLRASNVVAPSTTYTFSGYFKSSSSVTQVTLDITDNGNTTFDLTSEWQRFSITAESRPGGSPYHFVDVATNGIQGDTFYAWGLQLEEATYGTSYIPTDGGTVTRIQDQYSKTGISNLIGQNEGTLFVDVDFDTLSGLNMFLSIRPNSSNKIEIYRSSDIIYGEIASTNSFSFSKIDVTVGRYKIAVAYSSGSSAMYINGVLMSSNSTSFAFTSTLNDLYVGSRGGTSFIEQAKYNDIKLYKTRLSNSELATLTT